MKEITSNSTPAAGPDFESPGCGPLIAKDARTARSLRQRTFECVRAAGTIARVDVAKELGVSPASVTPLVAELIETGYLREDRFSRRDVEAGRGRPPVALAVRAKAGLVAGMKLSDHTHTAVIADFAGNVIAQASMESGGARQSFESVLQAAETLLDLALAPLGYPRSRLASVGFGVPGFVDHQRGIVHWTPLIDQGDLPLRAALQKRIGLPVQIDNDANLVTLAELWFGAGRSLGNFAVVTIEYGVGMGLVQNNRLYRGALGLGMELGHTKVQLDGALCRCGQRGCLEAYIADYALVREASTALNGTDQNTSRPQAMLETLYEQAKSGNDAARAIFDRAGRYLAVGLANITTLFDPALILLSGERLQYDYLYAEDVLAEMRNVTLKNGRKPPPVEIYAWGDLLWARGAAALALESATRAALTPVESAP